MTIYNYPCSVCQTKFDWSIPEPQRGNTCPECRNKLFVELTEFGEIQEQEEQRLHQQMDEWWNNLPKDDQEKAFFSIVKRLNKYECEEDLSYRQILDRFGFDGSGSGYYLGINCGFMNLHNCIAPHAEMQEMRQALREKKKRDAEIIESFRFKSQCDSCGYQSMDIRPEENRPCPHCDCNGDMR